VAAIKDLEDICPSILQVVLDEIPSDMGKLLSQSFSLLSPSSRDVSEGTYTWDPVTYPVILN
jgi:hypothetical protein